jgi:phenylacetic acid degradation operon negative regulatory protein
MNVDQRSEWDDFVLTVLWTMNSLMVPTLRSLTGAFEGWKYRHGYLRQIRRLADRGLIAREERAGNLVLRLTSAGLVQAMGGVDVVARWNRPWDRCWRQVLFDLPSGQRRVRMQLWRWLRQQRFGYLQNSVWVSPDPIDGVADALAGFRDDVESLVLMEARCIGGYSDQAIVTGAWDFREINKRYEAHVRAAQLPATLLARLRESPVALRGWFRAERVAWRHALAMDPLLPRSLWPAGYRGEHAWQARRRAHETIAVILPHDR